MYKIGHIEKKKLLHPDFAISGRNNFFFNGANLIFILWGKSGIIKFEFQTISVS